MHIHVSAIGFLTTSLYIIVFGFIWSTIKLFVPDNIRAAMASIL